MPKNVSVNIKPWIDGWVALQCCRISLWRILWGPRPKAMRSWEGNELSVISGTDLAGNFLSLSVFLGQPLPSSSQLIGKMCYNIFDGITVVFDCWLFYGLAYGQSGWTSGSGGTLWCLSEDLSTAKTCWILIRFVLMGCGCLPSCWPLCKVFESNSKISGNLIEPTSLPFSTETRG